MGSGREHSWGPPSFGLRSGYRASEDHAMATSNIHGTEMASGRNEPMAIAMTPAQLERLVRDGVTAALRRSAECEYLDQAGAAIYLAVSEETIRRWRAKGLPHYVLPPTKGGKHGVVRFRRRELDAWARKHRRKT